MKLATLCYVQNDTHTLMLHRNKKENDTHKGKWNGLGGKLEAGETPEDCVIREVYEESGLTIVQPQLKGLITFPMFDGRDDWYVFMFTARQYSGELIDSPEGTLQWIENEKVPELNLWEGDRIFIPWLAQKTFFSAVFEYEKGKYQKHRVIFYT
ncbi:MAG TPA: 8-oxo-dGTP diphosphatase [Caldithrix abyssi]|uniref:8-oxo-dGTP diphosphatase n=1 Tax=Caldithrix abyssi TaxID=187145 RepID=A0A7V1LLU7_CALAY|nr:8-oxo-dGTP diphosphatase [Caldithrix abyssi]